MLRRRLSVTLALVGALLSTGVLGAVPVANAEPGLAGNSGVISAFSLRPTSTSASGSPGLHLALTLGGLGGAGGGLRDLTLAMAPGLLLNPAAVPLRCRPSALAARNCPAKSEIAAGTAGSVEVHLFLMPSVSIGDLAGLGAVFSSPGAGSAKATGRLALTGAGPTPTETLSLVNLPSLLLMNGSATPLDVQSLELSFGDPAPPGAEPAHLVRLPTVADATGCLSATTTIAVSTSAGGSGQAAGSFASTGCRSAFAPSVVGQVTRDRSRPGARVVITLRGQDPAGPSAGQAVLNASVGLPLGVVRINTAVTGYCPSGGTCPAVKPPRRTVGSALLSSGLTAQPVTGSLVLWPGGRGTAASLSASFGPPLNLVLHAQLSERTGTLTLSALPDLPISSLTLAIPNDPPALFLAPCFQQIGTITSAVLSQAGAGVNANADLVVKGCAVATGAGARLGSTPERPPTVHGRIVLDRAKRPSVQIRVSAGASAPGIAVMRLALNAPLRLVDQPPMAAIHTDRPSRVSASAGSVVLKFSGSPRRLLLNIDPGAIGLPRGGYAAARQLSATASCRLVLIDAAGLITRVTVRLRSR